MLARGLSVRDIEDAFKDETGRLLLSRTAVAELGERLWSDYQEFAGRDLSEYGAAGKREYVQVLRLMETFRPNEVEDATLCCTFCFTPWARINARNCAPVTPSFMTCFAKACGPRARRSRRRYEGRRRTSALVICNRVARQAPPPRRGLSFHQAAPHQGGPPVTGRGLSLFTV